MKREFVIIAVLLLSIYELKSQEKFGNNIPMIGEDAPKFFAESTSGSLAFPDDCGQNWKILFSHPRDFTPVCSSEILQLARMQNEFAKLRTSIVVISTDFLKSHYEWKKELEDIKNEKYNPGKIGFPLVADDQFVISKRYGMMHKSASTTQTVRGVFFINPDNKIAAFAFYPMNIGRNLEDIKSTLLALQATY